MPYAVFLSLRLIVVAFALLSWAYSVTAYSPFAFDMFVRPRLFPWLAEFVIWHHAWYWAAYTVSVISLIPDLIGMRAAVPDRRLAGWAAATYAVVFGAVGVHLSGNPYLPSLTSPMQSYTAALMPLMPLVWLAVIDYVAVGRMVFASGAQPQTGQRQLLVAAIATAVSVWAVLFARAAWRGALLEGVAEWGLVAAWGLVLVSTALMIVYAALSAVTAIAATQRHGRPWEYGLSVALMAVGLCEFFRRLVFPSLSFETTDALIISVAGGAGFALAWSGLRLRGQAASREARTGLAILLSPPTTTAIGRIAALIVLPLATMALLSRSEQVDWAFIVQTTIIVCFGLALGGLFLTVPLTEREWSLRRLVMAPLLTLALVHAVPLTIGVIEEASADDRLAPEVLLDRYGAADPAFRFLANRLIERPGPDIGYYDELLRSSAQSLEPRPQMSGVEFSRSPRNSRLPLPHVFMFVIDGLRRDYLSPYNPSVNFTPAIDAWARGSLVFTNAFTKYGGTLLSMPSIWTGSEVRRAWTRSNFPAMNAIERLIVSNDYRFLINDHTVAGHLRPTTVRTFLDPDVDSVDTDVCSLVNGLKRHLEIVSDARPVFAFLAPMNVHILNRQRSGGDGDVLGFDQRYAERVRRVDGCFGDFIAYLKASGIYDRSVVLLTSDHGESLGEGGNWGHQFGLFPEDIRIPLIMSVPPASWSGATTDLGRLTFSTDIAPTLYQLLGYDVQDSGAPFGSPLFSDSAAEPPQRRRQSYLVMSSYGANYGLLRRNGKFLYISDLINFREYAFELFRGPLGEPTSVTDDLRRVNQTAIRQHVAAFDAFSSRPDE